MNEKKKIRIQITSSIILLLGVSLYRQYSRLYYPLDYLRPYIVYLTYLFLLLEWMYVIVNKITQKSMRIYLLIQSIIMLFYLTLRFIQDAFLLHHLYYLRYTGYLINIPALFVPLTGVYAALCLGKGDDYAIKKKWYYLLLPIFILIVITLTEDSHHFLFTLYSYEQQPNLYFHPNIGTYIVYLVALSLVFLRIYIIYQRNKSPYPQSLFKKFIPFYEIIAYLLFSIPYIQSSFVVKYEIIEYSAGLIFMIIGSSLFYMYVGLIPVNTRYEDVFAHSSVNMQLLHDHQALVKSNHASDVSSLYEALSLNQHTQLNKHTEIYLHPLNEHYALIWEKDLTPIQQAQQELQKINDELERENQLLAQEIRIQSNKSHIQARNQIYDYLSQQLSPSLSLLIQLLDCHDEKSWKTICYLGTYIKRMSNLHLSLQEHSLTMEDYLLALDHIFDDLIKIHSSAYYQLNNTHLKASYLLFVLEAFETILESTHFDFQSIDLHIDQITTITLHSKKNLELPVTAVEQGNKENWKTHWQNIKTGYQLIIHAKKVNECS